MNKTVSIIVPVYNCEPYIDKCLRSIQNQTYQYLQVIVVDDGSTDGSADIIDKYVVDARFEIIHQENSGVCIARNNALEKATGDYITFIDGDDHISPDYIERMITIAEEQNSELVISGFIYESPDGKKQKTVVPKSYTKDKDEMWAYRLSAAAGRLYSADFWKRNKLSFTLQKGVRGEDVPICLFANYAAHNVCVIEYAGYHYIQHADSAFHEYVGLRKHGFPYDAMDDLAEKVKVISEHNSGDYYSVGILKFFAQFYYQLGRGAENAVKYEMRNRFRAYVTANCPDYRHSWKCVKKQSTIPLSVYGAVELFCLLVLD